MTAYGKSDSIWVMLKKSIAGRFAGAIGFFIIGLVFFYLGLFGSEAGSTDSDTLVLIGFFFTAPGVPLLVWGFVGLNKRRFTSKKQ